MGTRDRVRPLFPIPTLHERIRAWREVTELDIGLSVGDLTDYGFVESVIRDVRPDAIVHYGEQPSAPYSMIDVRHATYTQANNVIGNLNVLFAIRDVSPETHLVKLGTMGEYGTPDIDIEEGYLTVDHNGAAAHLPLPEDAGLDVPPVEGARQPQHPFRHSDLGPARHRPQPGRRVRHRDRRIRRSTRVWRRASTTTRSSGPR